LNSKKCKYFDACSASLCPMETTEVNDNRVWYPNEEICRLRKDIPKWVRQQRKIAGKVKADNFGYYFRGDMLRVPFRVTHQVKGLDRGKDEDTQLQAWLKRNKGVGSRKVSEKVREQRLRNLEKARKAKALKQSPFYVKASTGGVDNQLMGL